MKPILPLDWGFRFFSWALRAAAFNPFDRGWRKAATRPPQTKELASEPGRRRPPRGLLLTNRGEVFREEGGLPVGEVLMDTKVVHRVWNARRELNLTLQGHGAPPVFANNGQSTVAVSVDALWAAMPFLIPSHLGDEATGAADLKEVRSWLEQLCEL